MAVLMVAASHITVLLAEATQALGLKGDGHYSECAVGKGGNPAAIFPKPSDERELLLSSLDVILVNASFASLELICSLQDSRPVNASLCGELATIWRRAPPEAALAWPAQVLPSPVPRGQERGQSVKNT